MIWVMAGLILFGATLLLLDYLNLITYDDD